MNDLMNSKSGNSKQTIHPYDSGSNPFNFNR